MSDRLLIEQLAADRVRVGFCRSGQTFIEATAEAQFVSPLSEAEREDLRWYLEDYLIAPFAVYEERGQAVQAKLKAWGEALFAPVFGAGAPGRDAYLKAREAQAVELAVMSASPLFLGLPWELLKDPERSTPLALDLVALDRTLHIAGSSLPLPPGEGLRVLMVIARPGGLADVGYQMVARPLIERLSAVRGEVVLEVLRPPTLEALTARLAETAAAGEPYHILHFDGHGTFGDKPSGAGAAHGQFDAGAPARGVLAFEAAGGGTDLVPADEFALAVSQGRVPLVVMNACRSGMLGEAAVEAAVATRLLEAGVGSVVAMGYSVYAVAAAEFMAAFYEALFAGQAVSQAVSEGRRRLYRERERPSPKGRLPLEDWVVPVHYLRRAIRFEALKQSRRPGVPTLDTMLNQLRGEAGEQPPADEALASVGRFVGRDAAFYTLELALQWQRVVVVHGPAGTGKTELAKAFARWWQTTGGIDNPDWVFFYAFEPGLASFGLDGVVGEIGLKLFGPDFIGKTQDAAERCQLLLRVMREHRLLLVWDNFESVFTLADPTGATPPLDESERARIRQFLVAVAQTGKSGVIITSRTPEDWLGEVRRIELGGLLPTEAAEMAEDVLRPYPRARARRSQRAYAELLDWLDGHPLSLRLLLPQLETVAPAHLLAALKGNTAALPAGFVGEGRLASLGASLKYSFDHLEATLRERLPALALFEGVADEDVLALLSAAKGVPARFAQVTKDAWSATLQRLAQVGLVSALGSGMYGLHPALPAYLAAEWRRLAGSAFEAEHAAAEAALLAAYAGFGGWLFQQIQGGSAETAFELLERQRRTMGRLLDLALAERQYAQAQSLLQPLNAFWDARGLFAEARGWVDRVRAAVEAGGQPPELDGEAGALWLFAAFSEANRALNAGDLAAAEVTYDAIRQRLEAAGKPQDPRLGATYHNLGMVSEERGDLAAAEGWYQRSLAIEEALGDRPGMASTYHHLGIVAQHRGDLAAAEDWCQRALEISKALNDRPGMAKHYHELGAVAQQRGDLAAAEGWYKRSLAIKEALGNRPGLASTYHQLGIVAQERGDLAAAEGWYQRALEIEDALCHRPFTALTYHELGNVAYLRGDLAAAEGWYKRSLAIKEALGDQRGMALTYAQLTLLFEERDQPVVALDWTVRCIALFDAFPHPATGPGPEHLARLTATLGLPALEASWQRCTGKPLPAQIRAAVASAGEADAGKAG